MMNFNHLLGTQITANRLAGPLSQDAHFVAKYIIEEKHPILKEDLQDILTSCSRLPITRENRLIVIISFQKSKSSLKPLFPISKIQRIIPK